MKRTCLAAVCLLVLLLSGQAAAEEPAEKLDRYLGKVLTVVQAYDQETASPEDKERLVADLSRLAREIFDFRIMARMCLARQWRDLSADQQDEYVRLFTRLLEGNYFGKMLSYLDKIKQFTRKDITIVDEIVYSEHRAEVKTVILFQDKEVPVTYRFVSRNGPWRIYDITLENISLVQNYRSQFKGVLEARSSEEFLGMLRQKAEQSSIASASLETRS